MAGHRRHAVGLAPPPHRRALDSTTATAGPAIDLSEASPTRAAPRSRESNLAISPRPRRTERARPPPRCVHGLADPQQRRNRPRPHTLRSHLVAVPRSQAAVACDFATIETVTLRRFYLLLCIDIATRTVYFAGATDHPSGVWATQAARNLLLQYGHQLADAQALVRDRASQFIDAFDEIFRTERMKILKTPVRAPVADAFAERWIGTLRRELLDRTVIWNRHQLERLVVDYIDHYNTRRPHRSLDQRPLAATDPPDQPDRHLEVVRTARCEGLFNEYRNAACQPRHSFRHPQALAYCDDVAELRSGCRSSVRRRIRCSPAAPWAPGNTAIPSGKRSCPSR